MPHLGIIKSGRRLAWQVLLGHVLEIVLLPSFIWRNQRWHTLLSGPVLAWVAPKRTVPISGSRRLWQPAFLAKMLMPPTTMSFASTVSDLIIRSGGPSNSHAQVVRVVGTKLIRSAAGCGSKAISDAVKGRFWWFGSAKNRRVASFTTTTSEGTAIALSSGTIDLLSRWGLPDSDVLGFHIAREISHAVADHQRDQDVISTCVAWMAGVSLAVDLSVGVLGLARSCLGSHPGVIYRSPEGLDWLLWIPEKHTIQQPDLIQDPISHQGQLYLLPKTRGRLAVVSAEEKAEAMDRPREWFSDPRHIGAIQSKELVAGRSFKAALFQFGIQKLVAWQCWKRVSHSFHNRDEIEADLMALKILALAGTKVRDQESFVRRVSGTLCKLSDGPELTQRVKLISDEIEAMKMAGFIKEATTRVLTDIP